MNPIVVIADGWSPYHRPLLSTLDRWPPAPPLQCDGLDLEPLQVDHAEAMVAVLADPGLYEYMGGQPPSLAVLRARYQRQTFRRSADGSQLWFNWVLRDRATGRLAGYVQASVVQDSGRPGQVAEPEAADGGPGGASEDEALDRGPGGVAEREAADGGERPAAVAEVAWVVGTAFQGHGFAGRAAAAMVGWLRGQGVGHVVAHIHPDNAASSGIARRLGLKPTDVIQNGEVLWVLDGE
jgi:RimJ/RimL family protein N-acetyltransferase